MDKNSAIDLMNSLGRQKKPFLFIIDFSMENPVVLAPEETGQDVLYDIEGSTNFTGSPESRQPLVFEKFPVSFGEYRERFDSVCAEIRRGNSYLLNLTCRTEIRTNYSLFEIFRFSQAKFKLLYKDLFVVFSPEIFIQIDENRIRSFPMKGTINAGIEDAERKILEDAKELAEHYTIVDLIRNDLSMVAKKVRVERFRYVDRVRTNTGELLQVSSSICGDLDDDYRARIGNILFELLPAGSVTGAPKEKTVEIIRETEAYDRKYYTGVFGFFDGSKLNSGVMIRFIEKTGDRLVYKSGGGITSFSDAFLEYNEMVDKVYVPVF